jgi:hypothetical protein
MTNGWQHMRRLHSALVGRSSRSADLKYVVPAERHETQVIINMQRCMASHYTTGHRRLHAEFEELM